MNYKKIVIPFLLLLAVILVAPQSSYAHNNENNSDKKEQKIDKKEVKKDQKINKITTRACRQLFWRLFAIGSLRSTDNVNLFIECLRPLGFEARFTGTTTPPITPTPTPDTLAPIITSISTKTSSSTISVSWKTNENATSRLYYSTSTSMDIAATSTAFIDKPTLTKNHSVDLSGLQSNTTYYMVAESRDASGNKATTTPFSAATTNL